MSRTIIKLTDQATKTDYYLEWSSIVDAPVTWGMSLDDFKAYYKEEYGNSGMRELDDRLERVELYGTSSQYRKTVRNIIRINLAGPDSEKLTQHEILEKYCINRTSPHV